MGPSALPETFNYRALLEQDSDMDPEVRLPFLPLPLANDIVSQIFVRRILAQSDQQCSLYLQQRLKVATSEERRVPIFKAVGGALIELSTNKFGASLPRFPSSSTDRGSKATSSFRGVSSTEESS